MNAVLSLGWARLALVVALWAILFSAHLVDAWWFEYEKADWKTSARFAIMEMFKGLLVAALIPVVFEYFSDRRLRGARERFRSALRRGLILHQDEIIVLYSRLDEYRSSGKQYSSVLDREIGFLQSCLARIQAAQNRVRDITEQYSPFLSTQDYLSCEEMLGSMENVLHELRQLIDTATSSEYSIRNFIENGQSNVLISSTSVTQNVAACATAYNRAFSKTTADRLEAVNLVFRDPGSS
jgi:hypothetical protein